MKGKRMGYLVFAKRGWGEYYLVEFNHDSVHLRYFKDVTDWSGTNYPHKDHYIDYDDGFINVIKSHLINNGWSLHWGNFQYIMNNLKRWLKQDCMD